MKENNREEDIKILEELLNAKITFTINPTDYGWKALEHLIKAYKELEEENKTLNERNQYLVKYRAKLEKELYESNENYIPISLVEEKIEKLKNEDLEIYDTDSEDVRIAKYEQRAILDFLQELLEKR